MAAPVRIGAVTYLNSKPLIYQVQERLPQTELILDVPSRLADRLASGDLDVALIPSFEFLRHPEYIAVSDACIASEGPVYSVKFFSRVPIAEIRSVALDEGSRTSVALTRILLEERHGTRPRWQPLPLGVAPEEVGADGVLLIGDRAIQSPPGRWEAVWDLGEEWTLWTGLPFVFALWAGRPGTNLEGIDEGLGAVRDSGLAHVDEIAATDGPAVGLTPAECRRYLTWNLHYKLGPREQTGLKLFEQKARTHNLLPDGELSTFWKAATAEPVTGRLGE